MTQKLNMLYYIYDSKYMYDTGQILLLDYVALLFLKWCIQLKEGDYLPAWLFYIS